MTVIQRMIPVSKHKIKCPYTMTPTRVVIHNTANDASAENEVAYMSHNNAETSFHYAVDDKEIIQAIPENRNAWHAGDGNGTGNREGIAIEICYSKSGGAWFEAAEQNAAELTASIMARYGWELDRVTKHQDYSGKYCPHRTLDLGWDRFKKMVDMALHKVVSDTTRDIFLARGNSYHVKLTSFVKPSFTVGNGNVLKTFTGRQSGNEYIFGVTATGKCGESTGVYTNDEKLFSVTII